MPALLTSRDFAPHLHSVFHVEGPAGMELTLTEVNDRSNAQLEQFSLILAGTVSPQLGQGICSLRHAAMGEVALFLVPLGPRGQQMIYEAVFTRLKSSQDRAADV